MNAIPTCELRWRECDDKDTDDDGTSSSTVIVTTDSLYYSASAECVLEQKWVLEDGTHEWRPIPIAP